MSVIQHVVLFKWKEGTPEAVIAEIIDDIKKLPETLPFIVALTIGDAFNDRNQGFQHCLTVTFNNREDLATYGADPVHMAVVKDKIIPNAADVIACDYESPVITGATAGSK